MWLSFARPEYLLLLPVAGGLLWHSSRVSYADLRGVRRSLAWALRAIILLALILALAGAQFVRLSHSQVVAFVVDGSYSIPPQERERALQFVRAALKARRPQDRGALVLFGRDATVESESLLAEKDIRVASRPVQAHTDIAGALRLAMGLLPPEAAGRLVLLSDGNENVGSVQGEVLFAQARGVVLDIVPLKTRAARDALVREVSVPSEARRGEPIPVRVILQATEPTQVRMTLLADDKPLERRSVTLPAGTTSLKVPLALSEVGFHRVDVLIEGAADQTPENDRGTGFVRVRGKPRVLIVDQEPADAEALRRGLGLQDIPVDVGGPAALPTNAADLERYDAVFLSNYPAYKMDERQMVMLRDATRDLGVGLGMIGGECSFGAGGYYQSPIEEALPVSMDVGKQRTFPDSAVLIVMDTSGSMGMPEDGVEKIQLAAEAACAVVDLLQPSDAIGFISSDPAPTVVCKLQPVGSKSAVKNDIRSVRAGGGGIACYPSLRAAHEAILGSRSSVRHVIMLADGSDCDEQPGTVSLARQMASERITVTTVAFGGGPHVPFLEEVAAKGKGQFYLTERARDLKKIFTRETLMVARSVLREEPFRPRPGDDSPLIEGVDWAKAPPLLGYVATSRKSLAKVPLVSPRNDPVLAHWQYGLGRSVAFTSDAKAHWAAHWLRWSAFPRFWGQAVRWSLRQVTGGVLESRVEPRGSEARIVVDAATDDGSTIDGLEVRANVNLPDGTRAEVALEQVAPGRYEAAMPTQASGAYVIGLTAVGPGGFRAQKTVGFTVPYPPDFADTQPNEGLLLSLAEQTGGRVLTDPAEAFTPPTAPPRVPVDIWRGLLWLAALLLPLDVAARRLVIGREDLAFFVNPVRSAIVAWRERPRPAPEVPTTVGRLRARKEAVREQARQEPPLTAPPPTAHQPPPAEPKASTPPDGEPEQTTTERLLSRKRRFRDGNG